jgi:hypothetical protein
MIQFLIAILMGLVCPSDTSKNPNFGDNNITLTQKPTGGENGQLPTPRP